MDSTPQQEGKADEKKRSMLREENLPGHLQNPQPGQTQEQIDKILVQHLSTLRTKARSVTLLEYDALQFHRWMEPNVFKELVCSIFRLTTNNID